MTTTAVPVYFEESWAILSSIGLVNVGFGLMIVGITSLSQISLVPIIVSAAGAIANGLCYYAFYATYPKTGTVVAAAVADIAWLVSLALNPILQLPLTLARSKKQASHSTATSS